MLCRPSRQQPRIRRRVGRRDSGSVTVEFVLLLPLLVLVLLLVVAVGRLAGNRQDLHDSAHQAARAASLARDPESARQRAFDTAHATLDGVGRVCQELQVDVGTADFRPGGSVRVRVACTVRLNDLMPLGLPGTKTLSAEASSPVDRYRGNEVTVSGTREAFGSVGSR
ncbi:TadE/TadG family type IV pilus assembly protein [Embleya sp. NPDC055664]